MPDAPPVASAVPLSRHVGVVVLPGFSLLAQACATEPLVVANRLAERSLYRLSTYAIDERPVPSAAGQALVPEASAGEPDQALDMLLVCAPGPLAGSVPEGLLEWLRRLAAARVVLGGIGGGTEVLARAACSKAIGRPCHGRASRPSPMTIPGCGSPSSCSRSTATA